ncbi:hypothetical protein [Spartinivicinus poritis]|uniref:DUF2232 domain-containing protein n=1 Tax=Spartinivicinus poritis TaxID=2994640 RepID=A0ABT5U4H0_9GAMM|nr:hypothetical protein [Spartinivicinus sp. A2-2]MDE1461260.1 hypothetical protein [Spartinivicinus sp. A2-2]
MRGLAELIMRSPRHAAGVAAVAAIVPFAYWLSAATVALVILRRGWQAGSMVLAWGLVPAIGLVAFQHDISPVMTILGASVLALVLRKSISWQVALLTSILVGLVMMLALLIFQPDVLKAVAGQLHQALTQAGFYQQLSNEPSGEQVVGYVKEFLLPAAAGSKASRCLLLSVVALMLARWWQSVLYVPGGFYKELFNLRFPPRVAITILILFFLGVNVGIGFAATLPIVLTPLFFAGLAMCHSIIVAKGNNTLGLAIFYAAQILLAPIMFFLTVLVALLDSFIDFRGRLNKPVG